MPIHVGWHNPEQTIVFMHFEGKFDFDDIFRAWDDEHALVRTVNHPVYALVHYTNLPQSVKGLNIMRLQERAKQSRPANLIMTIQVADTPMSAALLKTMNFNNSLFASTIDEALVLIQKHQAENK